MLQVMNFLRFLLTSLVFGIIGAYIRYLLSDFNALNPTFPLGTFAANVAGTFIASGVLFVAKFVVDYYDTEMQAILYGIIYGFCGCLTTVSTLVKEIDSLAVNDAYLYSFTTHAVSQAGIIFILNVYTYSTVPKSSIMVPPINMCNAAEFLCENYLDKIGCPSQDRKNIGCLDNDDYDQFHGICSCGLFNTDRINLILVDSQIKANTSNSLVSVWPSDPMAADQPTEVFDYCLTYDNLCNHFLNRINCPSRLRKTVSCDKK
jgi:fluoride ion exporter CrcB/FEX